MVELLGGMTQTDFNQQMSTTTEEAVHARKARSAREASAGVATPVCTSARNNGGHVATPSTIPTPKALFPGSPTHRKALGNTYGAGEADETENTHDTKHDGKESNGKRLRTPKPPTAERSVPCGARRSASSANWKG
jgi:hypothetical protein